MPLGLLARLAADPDPSVRSFLAMNEHLPAELLALLAAESEASVWMLSFSRGTHTCPPAAPAPPNLTRQQAESLLAQAGL
ncbi:hypothetical protein OG898_13275 [Streptomyces sp. NBC_00193]|uniref:hypothetical protein n=1 Tax=Streptomyces sp. NBC_00193 TaxID=2975675 RepID=UPI002258CC90|nr:hypothetical protein [Streptomyces sp. NBC_00193]MCX5297442.1 hypothetical protein [Streptomyces sp. NBC_00193]